MHHLPGRRVLPAKARQFHLFSVTQMGLQDVQDVFATGPLTGNQFLVTYSLPGSLLLYTNGVFSGAKLSIYLLLYTAVLDISRTCTKDQQHHRPSDDHQNAFECTVSTLVIELSFLHPMGKNMESSLKLVHVIKAGHTQSFKIRSTISKFRLIRMNASDSNSPPI